MHEGINMSMNQEEIESLMKELDHDYKQSQQKIDGKSKLDDILSIIQRIKHDNIDSQKKSNIDNILKRLENSENESIDTILSNLLKYNNTIQNDINKLKYINEKQIEMLLSLNRKFPNLKLFGQNLAHAELMKKYVDEVNEKLIHGSKEITQIIDLINKNEINDEKIDRIMSKINDLSLYINDLFSVELNDRFSK